jgi:hypothetical protein
MHTTTPDISPLRGPFHYGLRFSCAFYRLIVLSTLPVTVLGVGLQ